MPGSSEGSECEQITNTLLRLFCAQAVPAGTALRSGLTVRANRPPPAAAGENPSLSDAPSPGASKPPPRRGARAGTGKVAGETGSAGGEASPPAGKRRSDSGLILMLRASGDSASPAAAPLARGVAALRGCSGLLTLHASPPPPRFRGSRELAYCCRRHRCSTRGTAAAQPVPLQPPQASHAYCESTRGYKP